MIEGKQVNLVAIKEAVNFFELATLFEEEKIKVSYDSVTMLCPFHKERTGSFVYNVNKRIFRCFGCHESGDVFDYVHKKLGHARFKDTIDFLLNFTGLSKDTLLQARVTVPDFKKQMRSMTALDPKNKVLFESFTEDDVSAMVDFRGDFFLDRGFTKETLDFFGVGFDIKDKRVIVPIRDEHGKLVGVTGRTIHKNFKELDIPKWRHYKGSNISENFFNIKNGIEHSKLNSGSIIICEGPSDVMWLHQNGFKNAVACLNNKVTKAQKGLLLKNFMNVYLMLDGDSGGETGKAAIINEIKGYFNIFDVKIPDKKDPDDLSKEELQGAIDNARKI